MNTQLKKLALGLIASASLVSYAHADTTQPVNLDPVGATMNLSGSFTNILSAAGAFTDDYIFQAAPAATPGLLQFLASAGTSVTFNNVSLSYFGSDPIPLDSSSLTASSINAIMLNAGSGLYDLQISGVAQNAGANYFGVITENFDGTSVPVTPVPEPDAWALLLAGLVGLGAVLRHRRAT
ncbi:MAG: FxDxF family PEP-CTERM protein [Paucibacter sp.]|nr:FxDxF family PEP-CTERM protein [Roseateles sp.]